HRGRHHPRAPRRRPPQPRRDGPDPQGLPREVPRRADRPADRPPPREAVREAPPDRLLHGERDPEAGRLRRPLAGKLISTQRPQRDLSGSMKGPWPLKVLFVVFVSNQVPAVGSASGTGAWPAGTS